MLSNSVALGYMDKASANARQDILTLSDGAITAD